MERMYSRRNKRIVFVYSIDNVRRTAMVYDYIMALKNIGLGWQETKLCDLIPEQCAEFVIEQTKESETV